MAFLAGIGVGMAAIVVFILLLVVFQVWLNERAERKDELEDPPTTVREGQRLLVKRQQQLAERRAREVDGKFAK